MPRYEPIKVFTKTTVHSKVLSLSFEVIHMRFWEFLHCDLFAHLTTTSLLQNLHIKTASKMDALRILGLSEGADKKAITKAYKKM